MKTLLQVSLWKGLTHHAQMMLHSLDLEISAVPALKIAANELKPVTERWKSENKQKTNTKPINKKTDKHLKLNSKLEKFLLHVLV